MAVVRDASAEPRCIRCHACRRMHTLTVPGHDLIGIRAGNPGPFTLTGTNSWLVSRDPCWIIDPGPRLESHIDALSEEIGRRGGLAGILLTHGHPDHTEGVEALQTLHPAPLYAAASTPEHAVVDGGYVGPLRALATPGHAPDHLAFAHDGVVFSGDAVLGEGSVFISPYPGALTSYLRALESLLELDPVALCPGHGPVVTDPQAKLREYLEHRREREARLLDALARGARGVDELLDDAWAEVPPELRLPAAVTLAAHLDKLADEGRLPAGVERPEVPELHA